MAKQDLDTYWRGLAAEAGLSDEEAAAIAESLGNEKVRTAFSKAFVREPDFQAGLAKNRDEWQGKVDIAAAESKKHLEWYEKEAKPVFEQGVKNIQSLAEYKELYGDLDGEGNRGNPDTPKLPENVITRDDLEKALRDQGQQTVLLMKTVRRVGDDYFHRFKEPLPVDDLEKMAHESHLPLDQAYDKFIAPKIEAATTASWEVKLKQAKADGAK